MAKITSATMDAEDPELHAAYDAAIAALRRSLPLTGSTDFAQPEGGVLHLYSPVDSSTLLGTFGLTDRAGAQAAVAAARHAQPAWAATPWQERLGIIRRVADILSERLMTASAAMAFETGKTRLEALGEVQETADLFRYYADSFEENAAFEHALGNLGDLAVHTRSILRPQGVFAVISPFGFPFALAGGPMAAALIGGNTVVFKPSSACPLSSLHLVRAFVDAGIPYGVVNCVMGPGGTVGRELLENPGIDGIAFTGSSEVGMRLFHGFPHAFPRPRIVEMGGKNPAIVMRSADLEKAAEGIARSAFGFSGQKCSSNSRVYVERSVHDEFVRLLVDRAETLVVGDPHVRETFMGPVINQAAVDRFVRASSDARRDGTIFTGGERLTDGHLERGFFVAPTVVGNLPTDHRLFREELLLPFTAVHPVDSLDEAIVRSNDSVYGLTAGIFSEDPREIRAFLDRVQAGVLYVNRRAGATSGATPGVQSFGGWKGSGSTGRNALGMYYVAQFLREQSQTIVT